MFFSTIKKEILILLTIALLPCFWQVNFAHAEDSSEGNLQFSIDKGKIYFFQPQKKRIFVYQATTGHFSHLFTLEELGEDLRRSRLLPTIKEEQKKD